MNDHVKRSRVTKALTDAGLVASFEEAEQRLDAIRVLILVGNDQIATPAGQAAVLTAAATAYKCFGRVAVAADRDEPLRSALPIGDTLLTAARRIGASIGPMKKKPTHVVCIGSAAPSSAWSINCWWDRWLSGSRTRAGDDCGDSRLALAGVFSAALAVHQIFACVLTGADVRPRDLTVSLWEPWRPADRSALGPPEFDVPDKLWLVGLGHLGQGVVWSLCLLGGNGERLAVLQDDQTVGSENEATSLCVLPGGRQFGRKKTRVTAQWLECAGWTTEIVERRHYGDIARASADPPILLTGLDHPDPRRKLAVHGFPYMVDAGIGHGHGDFDGIQVRTVVGGKPEDQLWESAAPTECARATRNLERPAYKALDQCGRVGLAQASVAVPFVGAATGALVVAQAIRLASMKSSPVLLHLQLSAPDMPSFAGLVAAPGENLGSARFNL